MKSKAILFLSGFLAACVCGGCHPDTSGDTQIVPTSTQKASGNAPGVPAPGMSPDAQKAFQKGGAGK